MSGVGGEAVTGRDADKLIAALDRATGFGWRVCVCGNGRFLVWPRNGDDAKRLGWSLALVDCFVRGRRVVVVRDRFVSEAGRLAEVDAGRGWPDRAAQAAVDLLNQGPR